MGIKGVGEAGTIGATPAIANAVSSTRCIRSGFGTSISR